MWRKSSFSMANGDCVEVDDMLFRKSTEAGNGIAVQDSKNPGGVILSFTPEQWNTFLAAIQSPEL